MKTLKQILYTHQTDSFGENHYIFKEINIIKAVEEWLKQKQQNFIDKNTNSNDFYNMGRKESYKELLEELRKLNLYQ